MTDDFIRQLWSDEWNRVLQDELHNERSRGFEPYQFYTSGRASKDYPNKEDPSWWSDKGPGFVQSWINWRDACGLEFWTLPNGEPAIEFEVYAERNNDALKCFIDRVMVDSTGALYILDLKSGSHTPAWPRQLALNNLALAYQFGVRAQFGGFWSARKGGVEEWADLRIYDDAWLWEQVRVAREIRDQHLFAAQPTMLCKSSCGVRDYCKAVAGPLSVTLDATLTHNREEQA